MRVLKADVQVEVPYVATELHAGGTLAARLAETRGVANGLDLDDDEDE